MSKLPKIPLKTVFRIFMFLCLLGLVLIIASRWIEQGPMLYVGIGICLLGLVFFALFYRCPHCHKFIGRDEGKFCRYCGKEIDHAD